AAPPDGCVQQYELRCSTKPDQTACSRFLPDKIWKPQSGRGPTLLVTVLHRRRSRSSVTGNSCTCCNAAILSIGIRPTLPTNSHACSTSIAPRSEPRWSVSLTALTQPRLRPPRKAIVPSSDLRSL